MSNLFFGILTIIICFTGYFLSWKFRSKDKYAIAVLLLLVCGLFLRIYTSTDFYLHSWDERYHALVAKNLIHHPLIPTLYDMPVLAYDFRNWTANHIWLHKQPLPLWTMAASMWVFGCNEIALRLPSILMTTLGIWFTYEIGNYFFNQGTGYLAAFLFSINGLIIEITGGRQATDHIDVFFLFFIELAIFLSIQFVWKRKTIYNVLVGISIGAAILSKWLPALIVFPIWILIMIDSGSMKPKQLLLQFFIVLFFCLLVSLPWQLYIFQAFPTEARWEAGFNYRHITESLEGQGGNVFYFFNKMRINYGELIYLPFLWFLWKSFRNRSNFKLLAISIWAVVPILFFSIAKTKMQAYILFTSPALFLMTSDFWHMLYTYRQNHKLKWLSSLLLFLLIALPIRYTFERAKFFDKSERRPKWVQELKSLSERKIRKGVLFGCDKPVEAMFYTNLTAYPGLPGIKDINELTQKGFQVLLLDQAGIPAELRMNKDILILR
jgi:4-amino-4-deoxy-L-arabinose transferase-like glycosyltransferase